jgi:branched-chain amino acid transport system substrate-binding protein
LTAIAVGITASALALSACSSSKKAAGGGLGGGNSSSSGGASGQTFKIGYQGDLSSPNKQLGINEVNAVNLAVDQANSSGKFKFKLAVNAQDDGGTKATAPPSAAKLIQDPQVLGVVGPAFSGPTQANGPTYAAAGMALISPSATNETLTSSGYTTFHRIVPTDGLEGKATADFLAKKFTGMKVYVVDDLSTYGHGVGEVVRTELKAKGIAVDSQSVDQKVTNLTTIAAGIANSKDAAMYFAGYYAQAGLLAKALNAAGYKGYEISGNGAKDPQFLATSGAAGVGYYFACGCLDATTAPAAKDFTAAYTAKFNTPPSTYSPEAFDSTNAMIQTYATCFDKNTMTRACIEQAVGALNYQGITTTVKFQPNGEVAQATINLYQAKASSIALLGDIATQ